MPLASIHYNSYGWIVARSNIEHSGPHETLDLAIRSAHADGFAIGNVHATRGAVKEKQRDALGLTPSPAPKEQTK